MTDRAAPQAPESPAEAALAPVSRRERRKLELRARILETASELFSDHGFHETRVAEICDRADIAHKTFFNHFPTKLHLLRQIAHAGIEQLLVEIEAIRKGDATTTTRAGGYMRPSRASSKPGSRRGTSPGATTPRPSPS